MKISIQDLIYGIKTNLNKNSIEVDRLNANTYFDIEKLCKKFKNGIKKSLKEHEYADILSPSFIIVFYLIANDMLIQSNQFNDFVINKFNLVLLAPLMHPLIFIGFFIVLIFPFIFFVSDLFFILSCLLFYLFLTTLELFCKIFKCFLK